MKGVYTNLRQRLVASLDGESVLADLAAVSVPGGEPALEAGGVDEGQGTRALARLYQLLLCAV